MRNVSLILEYKCLEFLISSFSFEKALLGRFPYRAYMSHKNDNPNLTQKVQWSIEGLVVSLFI